MATKVGNETVKSPRELVVSAYAPVPDITRVVTPDIKKPGQSELVFIDLSLRAGRLGGSVLAQAYNQIGNESPDINNPGLLESTNCHINCLKAILSESSKISSNGVFNL